MSIGKSRLTILTIIVLVFSTLGLGAASYTTGSPFLDSIKAFLNTEAALPSAPSRTPAPNLAKNDLVNAAYQPMSPLADGTWAGTTNSTWLTGTNWNSGVIPGSNSVTSNPDICNIVSGTANASGIGINMNTQGGTEFMGAFSITGATATAVKVSNSSTTVAGIFTLNSTTVNSVPNVIVRNSSAGLFTLTNGTSSGTLGLALTNATDNIINVDGTGGVTIGSIISGSGKKLTKAGAGAGVLTLSGVDTYSGDTTINTGSLALSGSGAIANSPNINVAGGATFDISAVTPTTYTLAASQGLIGTGAGTTGTLALGTKGLTTGTSSPLTFNSFGGSTAPFTLSGTGTMTLAAGNVVNVNTSSALGTGDYVLINKGAGPGVVGGTLPTTLNVGGSGVNGTASLLITGSQLVLHVASAGVDKMVTTLPGQTFTSGTGNSGTVTAQTAGTAFNLKLTATLPDGVTTDTSYTGTKTINYTGPGGSPTYTTSVSFTSGQAASVPTTLTLAQTTTITASDGTLTGVASSSLLVNPGAINSYVVSATSPQPLGVAFSTSVTAKDANANTVTTDSSTVVTMTSASGNMQFDSNGDATFGDNTKALTNGAFTISTKDNVAETTTITATDANSKTGTSGSIAVSNLSVNTDFFRSLTSGSWATPGTWESSHDGSTWITATLAPDANANTITIRNTHTVTVDTAVSADQVTVDFGGQITIAASNTFTLANGTGTDITVNGTVIDSGTFTVSASATWAVGSGGTFVYNTTTGISGALGSATLDAASTFIYRGSSTLSPTPSISARTYGNLVFESTSGSYATTSTTGAGALLVNGSLSIGSTGAGTVSYNTTGFTGTITVNNGLNIGSGSTFTIGASTTAISGTSSVQGTLTTTSPVTHTGPLGGIGTVGAITMGSGGIVAPGNSPGTLNSGSVIFNNGSAMNAEFGATADQLNVTGTVTINATSNLNFSSVAGISLAAGQVYTIINNDGSDTITGTFSNHPDGEVISNFLGSGLTGKVSYSGGTNNNDLTVTIGSPAPTVASISPTSGTKAGGTLVTIGGTNFTGATGVTIGGNACTSLFVQSGSTIQCLTPAGTLGTASVLVTTPNGTNSPNSLYTYTNSAPIASTFSTSTGRDTTKTIVFSATDADSDTLTFNTTTAATHGTISNVGSVSCSSGTCTKSFDYTPNAGYVGSDSISYTANDGTATSSVATISIDVIQPPLSGTYTVGSGGYFPTLTAAVSAYNSVGVTGPTTFSLTDATYPAETYPIIIGNAPGVNATNTLTIKPASGVSPTFSTTTAGPMIKFDGASFITIDGSNAIGGTTRDLTITNTDDNGEGVRIVATNSSSAANNIIESTNINELSTAAGGFGVVLDGENSPSVTGNTIQNNVVTGGSASSGGGFGIATIGANGTTLSGNAIIGNTVSNFLYGVYLSGRFTGDVISGNTITDSSPNCLGRYGIYDANRAGGTATISGNKIGPFQCGGGGNGNTAIDVVTSGGEQTLIADNMIVFVATAANESGLGIVNDISNNSSGTITVRGNSINMFSNGFPSVGEFGVVDQGTGQAIEVKDNIIAINNTASGTALRMSNGVANLTSDYNDLYVTGGNGVNVGNDGTIPQDYQTLALWQAHTGGDAHSISADPNFTSTTNLHIKNGAADPVSPVARKGITIVSVPTDFDGDTRKATPDIGADEFVTYALTYTAGANGSLTGTTSQIVNPGGSGSAVTAVPANGYHFVNWSDSSTSNPRTDTNVNADTSVTANFALDAPTVTSVSPTFGPTAGGTSVTITGTNFSLTPGGTVVKFGTTTLLDSAVTVDSSTQITATSPAHAAGVVDVTVTTSGGTSAINAPGDQFTFTTPRPTVQASNINFTNVTQNSMTVNWTNGDGADRIVIGSDQPITFTPTDGTSYPAGTQITANHTFVLFNGTGSSFDTASTVGPLPGNITVYFQVFEYNGSAGGEKYLTTTATNNPNSGKTLVATYTWNGSQSTDWTVAANWTPARKVGNGDILQFNNGLTDNVTNVQSETIGQLSVSNNTIVNLSTGFSPSGTGQISRAPNSNTVIGVGTHFTTELKVGDVIYGFGNPNGPGMQFSDVTSITNDTTLTTSQSTPGGSGSQFYFYNNTLTMSGQTGTDLTVASGSQLNINGSNPNNLRIALQNGVTADISGNMTVSGSGNVAHRLTALDPGAISFESGAVFTSGANFFGSVFGNTALNAGSVIFKSGSTYDFQNASASPFGAAFPNAALIFQSGSLYKHESSAVTPSFNGRKYANVEINSAAYNGTSDVSFSAPLEIDNLTVTAATNFGLNFGGGFAHAIHGNIVVNGGSTVNIGSGSVGADSLSIQGNVAVNSGALNFNPTTTGTVTFNGLSAQTISGAGTLTFNSNQGVTVDDPGLTLSRNVTLGGPLALTNGLVSTGANILQVGSTGSVTRTNGYVVGNLQKNYVAPGLKTFEVGTANGYSPVDVNVTTPSPGGAPFTVKATQSAQPNVINAGKALSRYWTLSGATLTADLTFHYIDPTDIPGTATEGNFVIARYNGSWSTPGGTVDTSANTATITGVSSFSDWTLAEQSAVNTAPVISPTAGLGRQQGSSATNSQIATISDDNDAAGSLTVTVQSAPAGISVTNIVNTGGNITADVSASCGAATGNNTVVLQSTDSGRATGTANLVINVTANTAPTVTYGNASANFGGGTTNATTSATDNGSIASYALQSQGTYTGGISVDASTGLVTFTNAAPAGTHTITIRATDNCGLFTDATFTITVTAPDYSVTTTGNAIVVTDLSGNGDTLTIDQPTAGTNIRFAVPARTFSVDGAAFTTGNSGSISLAGVTQVTVNAGAGNDGINTGSALTAMPNLTINGGTGNDTVAILNSITFNAGASFDADLQNDDATPGVDVFNVGANAQVVTSGAGTITVRASQNVAMTTGSKLQTQNGNIVVEANQQATPLTSGGIGVNIDGATIQATGTGIVTVKGKGGSNVGISIVNSALVKGGSTAGTTTAIVDGTGGSQASNMHGIQVGNSGLVTSFGGNVSVTGHGGTAGSTNIGIILFPNPNGGQVSSGGNGTVTVSGTGGSGGGSDGVRIDGSNVTAGGSGTIGVTGTAGPTSGPGISVSRAAFVQSTTGVVTLTGTGTGGGNGIQLLNGNTSVLSGGNATVNLIADVMDISGATSVSANSGIVNIRQLTNGKTIDLGGADSPTQLGLTATELARVTAGTLNIGDANTGPVNVSSGISITNKTTNIFSTATTTSAPGSDLGIFGTVNSTLAATFGALRPGGISNPGVINSGNLSMSANSTYVAAIGGTTPGNGAGKHSQINVTGTVTLGGTLTPVGFGGFNPANGNTFVIINNDGGDAVSGTFNGLPEGATYTNFAGTGRAAKISYVGGDGNDVVLTAQPIPGTLSFKSAPYSDSETNTTHNFTVTVQRTGGSDGIVGVHYATSNGTATAGSDYTATSGDLTWANGDTADKTFTVSITGDTTFETNETVNLTLSDTGNLNGATIGAPNPTTLTITNDDPIPATLVVNSNADTDDGFCTADPGGCTLREAINAANSNADVSTINFNIPGGGVQTIAPTSSLPSITTQVTINGYTQPGASVNTNAFGLADNAVLTIQIDGTNGSGLEFRNGSTGSIVRGLVINRCNIGVYTDPTGTSNITIAGNFIGTTPAGGGGVNNGFEGIELKASGATVGGTSPADRNIISGNSQLGIQVVAPATNDTIQGNYIGTDATGTAAVTPNAQQTGISIQGGTSGTIIGGSAAGAGNVISGDSNFAINSNGNATIKGNRIGTKADGTGTLGARNNAGINVGGGTNVIGGTNAGEGNLITNANNGIILGGGSSTISGNTITGNGTTAGNNGGIQIARQSSVNTISFNTITNNTSAGVIVDGANAQVTDNTISGTASDGSGLWGEGILVRDTGGIGNTGNTIARNSIHDNANIGIDLSTAGFNPDGITANDTGDGDSGTNGLQNFPVITSATANPINTIAGTLNTTPGGGSYKVEFFSNPSCDPSGNGEGQTFLGSLQTPSVDGSGNASFTFNSPALTTGQFITATATDPSGSTSEFSQCFTVGAPPPPTNPSGVGAATPSTVTAGNSTLLTVSVTGGTNPASTGLTVTGDLTLIGGSNAQQFYDDGTHGDVTPGDTVFSYATAVSNNATPGNISLPFTVNDAQSRTGSGTIAITVTAASCAAQPAGMVAWYPGENNALDIHGGNNGTLQNGTTFGGGKVGQAISFDGVDDYVQIPRTAALEPATITLDTWVNFTSLDSAVTGNVQGTQRFVHKQNVRSGAGGDFESYDFGKTRVGGKDVAYFCIATNAGSESCAIGTTPLATGTWYHIAGTYDLSNLKVYLNGNIEATTPTTQPLEYDPLKPVLLGRTLDASFDGPLNGRLDEVEIFQRALTGPEIAGIYNASTAGKCFGTSATSGTVGWWPGDGDARDITGNGNNGTLANGAGFGLGKVGQTFNFDGVDDVVTVPNSPGLQFTATTPFSIETWVDLSVAGAVGTETSFVTKWGTAFNQFGYGLRTDTNTGKFALEIDHFGVASRNVLTSTTTPAANTWYHLVGTSDGSTLRIYVNGVLEASMPRTAASGAVVSPAPLEIGVSTINGDSGTTTPRRLDETFVYSRALSANEIASDFNAGLAGRYKSVTTPTGSNVSSNAGGDATVAFSTVNTAGTTQQVPINGAQYPALPGGQTSVGLYYDISTAASYTGPTTVCFHLPLVTSASSFGHLRIDHLEGGVWVDRTNNGSSNFGTQTLCTVGLGSLSPFAIGAVNPTAAGVTVSGRVLAPTGGGLRNASVVMTGSDGATRRVITNAFGYYTFNDVTAGGSYIIGVESRRFHYATRVVQVSDTLADVDFTPME